MAVDPSRQKLNTMVHPSQIGTFLCFTCGDMFQNNPDYTRHMLEHQAVSLCCQLYYLEYQDKKQGLKKRESGDWKEERDARSVTPQAEQLQGRRNTAPATSAERRMSVEMQARNQRVFSQDEGQPKKRGRKPKNKPVDDGGIHAKKQKSVEELEAQPIKQRRESLEDTEPQAKKPKLTEYTLNETKLPFDDDSGYLELVEAPSTCPLCPDSPLFMFPILNLSHYVSEHGSEISRVYLQFFSGNQLLFTKFSKPGRICSGCGEPIETDTGFHLHLLESHMAETTKMVMNMKDLQKISKVEVIVHHQPKGRTDFITTKFDANLISTTE